LVARIRARNETNHISILFKFIEQEIRKNERIGEETERDLNFKSEISSNGEMYSNNVNSVGKI
jgi:hypothetical protein